MRILFFLLLAVNLCFFLGSWGEYRVRTGQQIGPYAADLEVLHTLSERAAGLPAKQYQPSVASGQVMVAAKVEEDLPVAPPLVVSAYASEKPVAEVDDSALTTPTSDAVGENPIAANAVSEPVFPESELEALVAGRGEEPEPVAPVATVAPVAVARPTTVGEVLAVTEVESLSVAIDVPVGADSALVLDPVVLPEGEADPVASDVALATGGCMIVGPFAEVDAALAIARKLESFGYVINYHRTEQSVATTSGYSVLLPPAASRGEALRAIERLRAAGVTDHYLIKDGVNKHGVMLGFYRDKQFADERVQQLTAAGFAPRVATKQDEGEAFWLEYEVLPGETRLPEGVTGLGEAAAKLQACS